MDKKERKAIIRQQTKIPAIIALVGAVLMVLCVLLPYSTATAERAEWIHNHPDSIVLEKLELTAADMKNVSMVQYARIYHTMSEEYWHDSTIGIFYIVLVALIGGGAAIAALFAWGRKPVGTLIFGGVSYGVFQLLNADFTNRGVIPNSSYDWGIAHTLFPIAAVVLTAGAVWMFVKKIIAKKQCTATASAEMPTTE